MSKRFTDQVILITGGTSGIGLETAIQFVNHGARDVIVCGRGLTKWEKAQKIIRGELDLKDPSEALIASQYTRVPPDKIDVIKFIPVDVRVESDVKDLIEQIFIHFKRLDVCFNNAGVQPGLVTHPDDGLITDFIFNSSLGNNGSITYVLPSPQPSRNEMGKISESHENTNSINNRDNKDIKIPPSQKSGASPYLESELATSCIGVSYCLKWELKYILELQPKNFPVSIINTASRNGILPDAHRWLYAGAKAFIIAITKSIANQMAQKSLRDKRAMIRINSIAPGPVDTLLEYTAYGLSSDPKTKEEYEKYAKEAAIGVPMKRTASVKELAPSVLFLADYQMSSYITGTVLSVDGGHTGSPLLCKC